MLSVHANGCYLGADGNVQCWHGLEKSADAEFAWPLVDLPAAATDLAAGSGYGCAVLETGEIACWGAQAEQQLSGNLDRATGGATIVDVDDAFVHVAASTAHTCGTTVSGRLWCWGRNLWGELGYADPQPVGDDEELVTVGPVPLVEPVRDVATGYNFTCALLENGGVRCWGYSFVEGTHPACPDCGATKCCPQFLPTELDDVPLPAPAVQITAGETHACALTDAGSVYCWGPVGAMYSYMADHPIGDDESPLEVGPVALGGPAVAVSAGYRHTCVLLDKGQVRCWGYNDYGELGIGRLDAIGNDEPPAAAPIVELGAPALSIAAGRHVTCAELPDAMIRCWGDSHLDGVPSDPWALGCYEEYPNPDQSHGSSPTVTEFACTNGPLCCIGDDEAPADGEPVPL